MALSINRIVATGAENNIFPVSFELGILRRVYVSAYIEGEVDGLGDQIFRGIDWINDGLVELQGDPITAGQEVVIERTIPKDQLEHSYTDGAAITRGNLDDSNLQHIMSLHELFDGRFPVAFQQDLNMGNWKIINLAP